MRASKTVLALLAFILIGLSACGNSDLSRSSAAQQIAASQEIQHRAAYLPVRNGAVGEGQDQGVWDTTGKDTLLIRASRQAEAAKTISGISPTEILAVEKAKVSVVVTGISDVPGTTNYKDAEFSWTYENLQGFLLRFAAKGGTGIARFRLYDDGWRLESATTTPSTDRPKLLESEQRKIADDLAAENVRLQKAAEQRHRLDESKTPTTVLLDMEFPFEFQTRKVGHLLLTDTDFEFNLRSGIPLRLWFGYISRWSNGPDASTIKLELKGNTGDGLGIPVPAANREKILSLVGEAVTAWRSKYADLSASAAQ